MARSSHARQPELGFWHAVRDALALLARRGGASIADEQLRAAKTRVRTARQRRTAR